MTILTSSEKVMLDEYFVKYDIQPDKAHFIHALSNIVPEWRTYEIFGTSNFIALEPCQAYDEYIEEILHDNNHV